ncbi:MAG: MSMEG_4193 family putative phosphomutase [Actinomycetota bacterium]
MAKRTSTNRSTAPTLVLLVRHGKTPTTGAKLPGRAPGLHLADLGREQAQAAADRIAELDKVAAVYASPLERTRETAAPIAKAHKLRARVDQGLLELDVGDWTEKRLSDLRRRKEWTTVQRYPSGFTFPGGESFGEMQQRITGTLRRLVGQHPGETIVAVSHADPIRAAIADAMGTHLDLFQRIVVGPCSVSAILFTSGGPLVLAVNTNGGSLKGLGPA